MKQVKWILGVFLVSLLLAQGVLAARTWPTLRSGDVNTSVVAMQYLLRHRGYSLSVDGDFGSGTRSRVISFQSSQGLVADGIVGTNTWEQLIVTTRQGDSGNQVRAIQYLLRNRWGYNVSVDGIFGSGTASTVRTFQTAQGLSADAIVGANTWAVLLGGTADGGNNGGGGGGTVTPDEQFLQELVPFVTHWEGRSNTVYLDSVGIPTVGVGFNLHRPDAPSKLAAVGADYNAVLNGASLTDAQIDQLLAWDLETYLGHARDLVSNFDQHPDEIRQILVDMTFNLGRQGFANFVNTRAAFEAFDYAGAANGMQNSLWYTQVGRRSIHHVDVVRSYSN